MAVSLVASIENAHLCRNIISSGVDALGLQMPLFRLITIFGAWSVHPCIESKIINHLMSSKKLCSLAINGLIRINFKLVALVKLNFDGCFDGFRSHCRLSWGSRIAETLGLMDD